MKKLKYEIGVDVAASSFYKRGKYSYIDPKIKRNPEEQLGYLINLIKNIDIFYIEDPFYEEDFGAFSKILENHKLFMQDLTKPKGM
jgi:enolase